MKSSFVFCFIFNFLFSFSQENKEDKTMSPYFFVKSDNAELEQLPLKSTSADVNIAGVIASVKITQVYENKGKTPLEAIYIFPASTRAAVYNMKMTIGERIIQAKIEEKGKARKDYEKAKSEGKSASLLEQERPNVFQMNIANIMPNDIIKVELFYTELLIPEDNIYEFVYPTVVGPRYSNKKESQVPQEDLWVKNPYTEEGKPALYNFDIKTKISAGMTIKDIKCETHKMNFDFKSQNIIVGTLDKKEKFSGNKDFVLSYRLAGEKIESGLLLYEGKDEKFFLAIVQPPKKPQITDIPPREYIFIVDVSGSMSGYPLDISKKLLKDLVLNLRETDKFNIMYFAGNSSLLSETSLFATKKNINKALNDIDQKHGAGSTELLPALKIALNLKGTEDFSRSFVIATDGYITVEKEAFDLIRNNLNKANFYSFGIGSSINRFLIEGIAHVGQAEPLIILDQNQATEKANKFRNYIENPVLTNINVNYKNIKTYDLEPFTCPDVLAERPIIIFGKYKGKTKGEIKITGKTGEKEFKTVLKFSDAQNLKSNNAIKYLWARKKIQMIDDYASAGGWNEEKIYDNDMQNEVTKLGLKYNLLTNYTSFIAIDNEVRNKNGKSQTVKQPLPLPKGISNAAISSNKKGNFLGRVFSKESKSSRRSRAAKYSTDDFSDADYEEVEIIEVDEEEKEEESPCFFIVEVMPEFIGNEIYGKDLRKFLENNILVPDNLKNIKGKVYVNFIIDIDGSIIIAKVVRGLHPDLDKEAIRVIKLTSKMWKPAEQRGKKVKISMSIPVIFK